MDSHQLSLNNCIYDKMDDHGFTIIKSKEEEKKVDKSSTVDVIFGYTSLAEDSLLIENYDFIQFKLNDVFENWSLMDKMTHFVYKGIKFETSESRHGLNLLKTDHYHFQEPIHNKYLPDFVASAHSKFDMIVLGECPNLIELFIDSKTMRSLLDADMNVLYKKIKDFYNGLKPNGILVNLFHNETDNTISFASFEVFYNYGCIWSLDVYLFLVRVMNKLFSKIESGIYQKEQVENLDQLFESTSNKLLEELFDMGADKLDNKNALVDCIDKTYFDGGLSKQKIFSVERPIVHVITGIVEEILKSSDEPEKK
jgi:hypothetical protein